MKTHAQTATEYLVILAVVIIIALIVAGALGGIPGIGGGTGKATTSAALKTNEIGVINYLVGSTGTSITLGNNVPSNVEIQNVVINGSSCNDVGIAGSASKKMAIGQRYTFTCTDVNSSAADSEYEYNISITFRNMDTDATFTQYDDGVKLKGVID